MKCIITRDMDGFMEFWPIGTLLRKEGKEFGVWRAVNSFDKIAGVSSCCVQGVSKLLGFTPRKGRKQIVDIKVRRVKE